MRHAISNIALPPYSHEAELRRLPELGISGLEAAPSRVWRETWHGLRPGDVSDYRKQVESAGLRVLGLHSLIFDQPDLGLFKGDKVRTKTLDFFVHLSAVCRDLGGTTLIWGGGRHRGELPLEPAYDEAVAFMGELAHRVREHGTVFCFEPLGPKDSDFINSVHDSVRIVTAVDHPALRVQLDAKALMENGELDAPTLEAARPYLVHVHANEPGLGVLDGHGKVDHAGFGRLLREIGYDGFVSVEQRMLDGPAALSDVAASVSVLKECYR